MKFIIDNRTECSDARAVQVVSKVIDMGLISGGLSVTGKQYCYVTTFHDNLAVIVTKRKSGTQTFRIQNN